MPSAAFDVERITRLGRRLRAGTRGEVLFDAASRGRYATDASIYQVMPHGVFVPRSDDDVAAALAAARELEIPVLARGAGTSQCGQTVGAALVIDYSKYLRRIVEIDPQGRTATVEPGLVLDHLNAALKPHGLWFPVDVSTAAQATLGGMAGNNSCGSRSIAYGNMVHNVRAIDAWLADGTTVAFGPVAQMKGRGGELAAFVRDLAHRHADEIIARWPTVLRRVAGYNLDLFDCRNERPYTGDGSVNLAHLLVGAEGTLALTRRLTLQLAELPRARALGVVNFATFRGAMAAAQHLVTLGPTAVELVDRTMIELARANPAFRPVIDAVLVGEPEAILLVEFAGSEKAPQVARLMDLAELARGLDVPGQVVELIDDGAQRALWEVRKAGLNIMMSLKGDGKPVSFIEDCAVPLEHLADYTDALTEVFARHGTRGTWYAHASVGTLHVRPILDMRRAGAEGGAAKMRAIADEAAALVRRYRGAYSGEHGDGLCRGEWIRWQFGPAIDEAFRAIKQAFDPKRLLSPNRIIDPPRMDDPDLFRFPPDGAQRPYRTITLKPVFDWSAWNVRNDPATEAISAPGTGLDSTGGFAKAVEMCNNNGHCRKFDAGTMCPSYRVTRDERHLTRGRANVLRLALSGQLDKEGLASEAVHDALDLCVGCKGCRRECPTGVDMARMKLEFLAHYHARHGFSVRDRLIAALPAYASAASRIAPLLNLRDQLPGAAWLSEQVLGFSRSRTMPRWRRDPFWRSPPEGFASRDEAIAAVRGGGRAVALFVDTFNGTFEPGNAHAAIRVLRAAGYQVHPTGAGGHRICCGRTYLATGMVDAARTRLRATLDYLAPLAAAGVPIVGLEPSCLLTLRDEALALEPGPRARSIAEQAVLLEELLAREASAGRASLPLRHADPVPILVHGHCHQKAFGIVEPTLAALRLIPDAKPQVIESSCCGMAGSFGFDAGHREVSDAMAEAALLPAIRAAPSAIIVADGTSCRHQIADGAQREAVHAVRLLDRMLEVR